ncbi:MFS transporter [Ornithinimicrobium cavernae]|uniref:MFS transporter n=1 Tax=Ornithinimicrobium cavernae TaxID=2666047 RepID=UPI000D69CEB4|nr:MFS transporter [Ornithinimicrobium cavernae]
MPEGPATVPRGAWRALAALGVAMLLGMATWFSAGAVVPQLTAEFDLGSSQVAWLTIGVQFGFVIGALALALTSTADRIGPRQLIAMGAIGAGAVNLSLLFVGAGWQVIAARILTGVCLAGVYPPGMKAISTWFPHSRATAVAVLIGALTLGSAAPHLVAAVGGLDWTFVVIGTSVLSAVSGVVAIGIVRDGPHPFPASGPFRLGAAARAFSRPRVLLTSLGYFGHMWELYAMWSWFAVFFAHVLSGHGSVPAWVGSLVTFLVIGIGALGCLVGGRMAERLGSARVAILSMWISGACALVIGWLADGPVWLVVVVALVWGFWIIPDSPQFSALITHVADQRLVGSVLTLQLALGYIVTIPIVWLVPLVSDRVGWGPTFTLLALGPMLGILAMRRLRTSLAGTEHEPVNARR